MNLEKIIEESTIINSVGELNKEIGMLFLDSREKTRDSLFFAIKGTQVDGHRYIQNAIENGATAIVCEDLPEHIESNITYVVVENSAKACGVMSHNFYGKPSLHTNLIGVTGTNGKTTTTTLLYNAFMDMGYSSALISTIENVINGEVTPSTHTTPNSIALNELLCKAVEKGCEYVFMEVSSHAIHQNRIAGLHFRVAAFTNISHDHLDYHHTFQEYIYAKKAFFDQVDESTTALINLDDKNAQIMVQNSKAQVKTYALKSMADYKGKILEKGIDGMLLNFNGKEFWIPLSGNFNAYNALLVYAIGRELNIPEDKILASLSKLTGVKGRFEVVVTQAPLYIVIDYAHTPDALENVLENLQKLKNANQRIITVFGCGGDRDKAKRPIMGKIACKYSDMFIITSDNPRTEDPQFIIEEVESGLSSNCMAKGMCNIDRRQAIKQAIQMANTQDIVLIAGKGHEDYQEINGIKTHFDDKEEAIQIAKQLNK